ncbi:MAG: GMC family oxidoreductase, partial [Rhodospirillales bacterium]|nr:GMC family oxidoreductase [Acetobacter sp.]
MKLPSSTAATFALAAASGVLAADFSFNQHEPVGKPLVSSFFGVPTNATYDYVVVGAGTAGLAFASRLSGAGLSVAVVEAGGFYEVDNSNLSVVPGYTTFYTGTDPSNYQPLIDWGINTTPQPGSADRILHYARGKTMGGSSARNYFLYHRPTVGSHQQWADEAGDDSYLWENMLPYYKQSVNATPPNNALATNTTFLYDEEAFTPAGGPLQVYFGNAVDPFGTWARQAFQKAGMTALDGISSGNLLGSAYSPLTVDPIAAQRQSSESSFLREALN